MAEIENEHRALPKKGDEYLCTLCNMKLVITRSCKCDDDESPVFQCCSKDMQRIEE